MGPIDLTAFSDVAGPLQTWVLPALLGLGLASATGLRTFLPLLMLALAARFGLFGIDLNDRMAWLADWPAIAALAVAAAAEFTGDKIPVVDHALNVLGSFTRPIAGAVAAASVFAGVDPMTAAIAGLIVGAPTAFAFNAADGAGYAFAADQVMTLDATNPQLAATVAGAFNLWKRFAQPRRGFMEAALQRVAAAPGLSPDVTEVVTRTLAA